MHDQHFADACRPARCVILRLQMECYSIGHELLLTQQQNPLITLSAEGFSKLDAMQQRRAVIRAALACCRNWEQNKKPHRNIRIWSWFNRNANWPLAIADFRNYLVAGSTVPPMATPKDAGGRLLGAPFLAMLIQFLIRKMGKSESEAYDYPLGLAHFHYFSYMESEGAVRIVNADELSFEEYCRREDEKAEKEKEAKTCQP